jgi:hypothetical protein
MTHHRSTYALAPPDACQSQHVRRCRLLQDMTGTTAISWYGTTVRMYSRYGTVWDVRCYREENIIEGREPGTTPSLGHGNAHPLIPFEVTP